MGMGLVWTGAGGGAQGSKLVCYSKREYAMLVIPSADTKCLLF
jgi:hypothetical protein